MRVGLFHKLGSRPSLWHIGCIVALTGAIYYNALGNGFVFDGETVVQNTIVKQGKLSEIFTTNYWHGYKELLGLLYRPLTVLSFAAEYRVAGRDPRLYHATNIILHIVNAVLLYVAGRAILKNAGASFWAAVLFSLHPVQTEAVANVAGRSDLLSMAFFLSTLLLYVRSGSDKAWPYGLSLICFFAGLLSKENAITLPAVLVVYDLCFGREGPDGGAVRSLLVRRARQRYLGYVLVAVLYLAIRYRVLGRMTLHPLLIGKLDNPIGLIAAYPRILTALKVLLRYLMLLVFPLRLSADYSYNQIAISYSFWEFGVIASSVVLAGVFTYWAYSYFASRRLFFCISFFFVTISVVSNIFTPIGTIMGERLLYLPSVGFFLGLGVLWDVLRRRATGGRSRWIPVVLFGLVAALYGVRSVLRNHDWRSQQALFESALRVCPNSAKVHYNLAGVYSRNQDYEREWVHMRRSLQIQPDNFQARNKLAAAYARKGWFEEAQKEFEEALRIEPAFADGHYNLALLHLSQGDLDQGIPRLREALRIKPRHKDAYNALRSAYQQKGVLDAGEPLPLDTGTDAGGHYNQGWAYQQAGEPGLAIKEYRAALGLDPAQVDALTNLGALYHSLGLFVEALEYYHKALSIDPGRAVLYNNIGSAWMAMKEADKAVLAYRKAVACSTHFVAARSNLASALVKQGKWRQAEAELSRCLAAAPDFAPAYNNMGHLYLARRMPERAVREFSKALELDSTLTAARQNLRRAYEQMGLSEKARALVDSAATVFTSPGYEVYIPSGPERAGGAGP